MNNNQIHVSRETLEKIKKFFKKFFEKINDFIWQFYKLMVQLVCHKEREEKKNALYYYFWKWKGF